MRYHFFNFGMVDADSLEFNLSNFVRINEDGSNEFLSFEIATDENIDEVSFVRIFFMKYQKVCDQWPSGGIQYDTLYSILNDKYVIIPTEQNGLTVTDNIIDIKPKRLDSPDSLKGFVQLAVDNRAGFTGVVPRYEWLSRNMNPFLKELDGVWNMSGVEIDHGYFFKEGTPVPTGYNVITEGTEQNSYDNDHSTGIQYYFGLSADGTQRDYNLAIPFRSIFDAIAGIETDKYILTYDIITSIDKPTEAGKKNYFLVGSQIFSVFYNAFINKTLHKIPFQGEIGLVAPFDYVQGHRINNSLNLLNFTNDLNGRLANNGCFLFHDTYNNKTLFETISGDKFEHINGHDYAVDDIEWSGCDVSSLPVKTNQIAIDTCIVIKPRTEATSTPETISCIVSIRNIQLLAEVVYNIKDGIYAQWQGRKNTTEGVVLNHPIDYYEHVLKLQNYSTSAKAPPVNGWGNGFIEDYTYLINAADIATLKTKFSTVAFSEFSRELVDKNDLHTESIKDELLRGMWCFGSQDLTGKERIFDMMSVFDPLAIRTTIAYNDIIPGTISKFSEPKKEDIFCQPSLKFGYNIGLEKI